MHGMEFASRAEPAARVGRTGSSMDGDVTAHARLASAGMDAVSRARPASRLKRRRLLGWAGGAGAAGAGLGGWSFAWEPGIRLRMVQYQLNPASWASDLPLSIAVLAGPHVGGPP